MSEEAKKVEGIDDDNYAKGYEENIKALKEQAASSQMELQKLCYEVFEQGEKGKELLQLLFESFVFPALANPAHPNYKEMIVYYEGVKEGFRSLKAHAIAHKKFIEAQAAKGE